MSGIVPIGRSGQILEAGGDRDSVEAARREGSADWLIQAKQVGGQVFEA
jgi:hypothetical protein